MERIFKQVAGRGQFDDPAVTICAGFGYAVDISGDRVWVSGSGVASGADGAWIDGATGATPLGYFASNGNLFIDTLPCSDGDIPGLQSLWRRYD